MRADAARNRHAILDAARALYSARGLDVPMSAVARTAGVGVGTVYRHFPDRDGLVQAVVADRLADVESLLDTARTGLAGEDPHTAWEDFLTGFLDSGLPMLLPVLVPRARDSHVFTDDLVRTRARVATAAGQVVRTAQGLGLVRDDIGAPEIVLMFAAALHRLPGLPDDLNTALLARRIPLLRSALRPGGDPLPGRAVEVEHLLAALAAG